MINQTVHVAGRTPGVPGKAPMLAEANGVGRQLPEGSHHEAVYLAAIIAMCEARRNGVTHIELTSPSAHLVNQMNGEWKVGPELEDLHNLARSMADFLFTDATFRIVA